MKKAQEPIYNPITYCEKEYPDTVKVFQKIMVEEYELFCHKQSDYGPSNIAMGTELKTEADLNLSLTGLVVRLNDKVNRLVNIVIKNNNRKAQNESVIDSFVDVSIYGIISQIVCRGSWGK